MSSAQPAAAADTAPLRFAARLSPAVRMHDTTPHVEGVYVPGV